MVTNLVRLSDRGTARRRIGGRIDVRTPPGQARTRRRPQNTWLIRGCGHVAGAPVGQSARVGWASWQPQAHFTHHGSAASGIAVSLGLGRVRPRRCA